MRLRWPAIASAITVALAATVLTAPARAQQDPPRDTLSAPAEVATPLALRPSKPLELAQEPPRGGTGWKIVAVLAVLGGATYYFRKRLQPRRVEDGQLTIVRRTTIGLRSELLIVNVEGQRLLVGVTPHSIQSLAVLDGDDATSPASLETTTQESPLGERFAAVLKSAETRGAEPQRPKIPASSEESYLAGQARGLLGLRRQG